MLRVDASGLPCPSAADAQNAAQISVNVANAKPIFFRLFVRRISLRNKKAPREAMGHRAALFLAKSASDPRLAQVS
jgi:hypothetical protein